LNKESDKDRVFTDILKRTKKALDELGIPFFLSSGTCLGYFREKKFIEHDYDIDIGISEKDYTPKIIGAMRKNGLHLYRIMGDSETGLEMSFYMPNTSIGDYARIDIFVHYLEGDQIYWTTYKAPLYQEQVKYRVSRFGLKKVKFMGLDVYVPDPTLRYIKEHYGDDWHIPKKDYFYATSPKSIVKN
jgi:hypothetical protein